MNRESINIYNTFQKNKIYEYNVLLMILNILLFKFGHLIKMRYDKLLAYFTIIIDFSVINRIYMG